MKNQTIVNAFSAITNEKEGQELFFLKVFGDEYADYVAYPVRSDGVYGTTIFEFKLSVNDNSALFQAIKYLSKIRNTGAQIPDKIAIVSLFDTQVYLYRASDFIEHIEKQYQGNPSMKNEGFVNAIIPAVYDFAEKGVIKELQEIFEQEGYTTTKVDNFNVVGLSRRYYKENKLGSKIKFFEALRAGTVGADILPWEGDETDFRYIMDMLNDPLLQKELGAFYTPKPYVKLAADLVREAIAQVPEGNDYIILDRCAGTGNLEELLTEEELSHCVLNTIELKEYIVLRANYDGRVREILPFTDNFLSPILEGGDALAYKILPGVEKYVNDLNCNIIILENPPYAESGAGTDAEEKANKKNAFKNSLVCKEMKKTPQGAGRTTNDIANLFIWSAQKYYLTKPNDAYINFSPAKYFKTQSLIDLTFVRGFGLNRKHFHASASTITLSYWLNQKSNSSIFSFDFYDINKNDELVFVKTQATKKAFMLNSGQYDKRVDDSDVINDSFTCLTDGSLYRGVQKKSVISRNSSTIIGYLASQSFTVDGKMSSLLRFGRYDGHGFYLRKDNFLEKLLLFANSIPISAWYEKDFIYKTADGYEEAIKDKEFLRQVLFFTAMSFQNKMRSLTIEDEVYINELCFDKRTLAHKILLEMIQDYPLSNKEKLILEEYNKALEAAESVEGYNTNYTYGPFQLNEELNLYTDKFGREVGKKSAVRSVSKNPVLSTHINNLKGLVEQYYQETIKPKLFKYELLK